MQDEDVYYEDAYEDYYDDAITGSDGEPMRDELADELDGILDSFLLLSLVGSIMFLLWYRAQRIQAHRQAQEHAAQQQEQQQRPAGVGPGAGGIPPAEHPQAPAFPPGRDANFPPWGVGGVGH